MRQGKYFFKNIIRICADRFCDIFQGKNNLKRIIKSKVKFIEEKISNNEEIENERIDEIIKLIETISYSKRDFEINVLYAKMILLINDEHSLDDAWWILSNMSTKEKGNFEWNFLMAKVNFEMGIYNEAKQYFNEAMKIDENDNRIKKLLKKYFEFF
jgi:tetratricopeptide (TPR) repeat protein